VPQYHRERKLTNDALAAMDLDWYRALARRFASEALGEFAGRGRIDLVQNLSWLVPIRLCEDFFGVPGPDRRTLARWVRYIFQHLFLNIGDDPVVAKRAETLSVQLRLHVDRLIVAAQAELAAGNGERGDFLSQLVRLQHAGTTPFSNDAVLRNLAGVFLGSVDTVSRAVVNAVEELLARPTELLQATNAALTGDRQAVAGYVFEALRFNPHNPLVVRHAAQDTTLRTRDKTVPIAAGRRVFAMTYSAMFDPNHYDEPARFRSDRAEDSHLQFGFGFHRCFGEQLARVAVVEIVTLLLQLPGLARARGDAGRLIWDGPFPDHFGLTFEPSPALSFV
jgi:cytochrome P450